MKNRTVILGTDWWTDCDDVAAVRIACRADKAGLWKLAGVVLDACAEYSAPSLNAFLTSEGYENLPLGIDLAATDYSGNPPYQKKLTELPHSVKSNHDIMDGLALYKKLIREADSPVELLEIGFPQVLGALCADSEGFELLKNKVKCIWMMAGQWDNNGCGSEHNINNAPRSRKAAAYLFENCPCPIVFLGWEIGHDVISGKPSDLPDDNDPLRMAFVAHGSIAGRSSWDPLLILLALEGDAAKAGYSLKYGTAKVNLETGENSFIYDDNGNHAYVIREKNVTWYENQIARWLKF